MFDSGDLKSQAVFAPYRCLFFWQTRRWHESRPDGFRTVVGLRSLQSLRTPGRSVRIEPRHQALLGLEPSAVHDVFTTHPTRGLARSRRVPELAALQALPHRDSRQDFPFHPGRCQRAARLAAVRSAGASADRHCGRVVSRRGQRPGAQRAFVCDGLHDHRPVSGAVSLGRFPLDQGGGQGTHTSSTCVALFLSSCISPTARCTTSTFST